MVSLHNQDWKVVKNHNPLFIWGGLAVAIALMLSLLVLSFWGGKQHANQTVANLSVKVALLKQSNEVYRARMSELRQQITSLTLGATVDRQASEQLRQEIVALQAEIDGLDADVRYYRRLMAPELDVKGLQIGDVTLELLPGGTRARYRIMAHQISRNHKVLLGSLTAYLVGQVDGKTQRMSLHHLSPSIDSEKILLRFKYFQILEGILNLPEGWEVHQLELEANAKAPEKKTVTKRVDWPKEK